MEKLTKEQLEKLPKWAKSYIIKLENEVSRLSDIDMIINKKNINETNTHVLRLMEQIPLPNNTIIQFGLGLKKSDGRYTEKVEVNHNRTLNSIRITTDSSMGKKMAISPIASNTFDIVFHDSHQFDKDVD